MESKGCRIPPFRTKRERMGHPSVRAGMERSKARTNCHGSELRSFRAGEGACPHVGIARFRLSTLCGHGTYGCDFHPSYQQVAVFDKRTGELEEKGARFMLEFLAGRRGRLPPRELLRLPLRLSRFARGWLLKNHQCGSRSVQFFGECARLCLTLNSAGCVVRLLVHVVTI